MSIVFVDLRIVVTLSQQLSWAIQIRLQAGGLSAISRWLRSAATTPPGSSAASVRIPEGCQRGVGSIIVGHREPKLRSLRDRHLADRAIRGCRFAQPPANGWHPSGMTDADRVDGHLKKMEASWK